MLGARMGHEGSRRSALSVELDLGRTGGRGFLEQRLRVRAILQPDDQSARRMNIDVVHARQRFEIARLADQAVEYRTLWAGWRVATMSRKGRPEAQKRLGPGSTYRRRMISNGGSVPSPRGSRRRLVGR
ncbi:hypothetical protein DDF67_20940 [Caulobacter endophyticus]|uniref:Uncharacterized protein n=1 Tax=Caulobacter endophyticus TaxID=2172652 RepID=A0A2T9JID1_9CAUL|nr:hypothetical protein DDF67_20940 [Caulobacter endophyticus]